MNTLEVADLFKNYCDESDATFMDNAQVASYLNLGYDQFRKIITEQDNNYYYNITQIVPTGQSYNLALSTNPVRILGQFPTDLPMYRLLRVGYANGAASSAGTLTNYAPLYLKPGRTTVDVTNGINMYMYFAQSLLFSNNMVQSPILIEYVPKALRDVGAAPAPAPPGTRLYDPYFTTTNTTVAGSYIDDLSEFHDLIALLAYRQYAIKDFATNPVLEAHRTERIEDLKDFFASGASWAARTFVIGTDEDDYIL